MAAKMPLLLCEELAVKRLFTIFTLVLTLNSSLASEGNQGELHFSEVALQLVLVAPEGRRGAERISLSLSNAGTRSGVFRLPSPYGVTNSSKSSFAPFPPYVALLVKEPKSGNEEVFVLTSLRKLRGPGERVSLKSGQVRRLEYTLNFFCLCGPGGPRKDGSFRDCLKPGDVELQVRAMIYQKGGEPKVLSNPQSFRCSFPEWLFKGPFMSHHSRRESSGNPGSAAKPEPNPVTPADPPR